MPQATATQTASSFWNKPVTPLDVAWSGRIDTAEMSRPGGLLIAALAQSADEKGLSLGELATALGVSYWDLSQLRIGVRPIDALDEVLAEACARFLDLPRLTIAMLAGLLDPEDALQSADLSGEDVLHACRLLAREPGELELLPPANRQRPLQAFTVDALWELHKAHAASPAVCEVLRSELRLRPASKTERLRAALNTNTDTRAQNRAAAANEPPAHGIMRCGQCQTRLRIPHLSAPGEIRCPSCETEYSVSWQALVCVVQPLATASGWDEGASEGGRGQETPASGDAWSVLGLTENSPREAIERARRSLLQQYHPDRLGHVSPLVRQLAEAAFKRVNNAYDELRARR